MLKYDGFRFSLERFHHDQQYIVSASYITLGDLIALKPDNEMTDEEKEAQNFLQKGHYYNLTLAQNINPSAIIGHNQDSTALLKPELINGQMKLELNKLNGILKKANRKFIITENKFHCYAAYNLAGDTPFGYHPIEKYFEQPDWLLPHLNSKQIHTRKIVYIEKD